MNVWFDLQDALRAGVAVFVNGEGLTRATSLLYPYVDHVDPLFWSSWASYTNHLISQVSIRASHAPRLLPSSGLGPKDITAVSIALAELASWLQQVMPDQLSHGSLTSIDCLKTYDPVVYQNAGEYLRPIVALQRFAARNLADLTIGAYLHGSMSTLDYVEGSSDVDALVVIKNETLQSPGYLQEIRRKLVYSQRWLYRIDYSQHHGYSILSELDLCFFGELLFPRILLSHLTPLVGASTLRIRERNDSPDLRSGCLRTAEYVCTQIEAPEHLRNWFSLKLFLQSILLLPTLFLQAKGISVYKRDSFELARQHFSAEAWTIVDKATRIRNLGPQKPLISKGADDLIASLPNPWLASIVHRKLRNRVSSAVWGVLSTSWLAEAERLAIEVKDKVTRE